MLSPELSAKFHREAEDAITTIQELTHAADSVVMDYLGDRGERIKALEILVHAIRYQTSTVVSVCRIAAREGERDSSPEGASLYRLMLRLELSHLEDAEVAEREGG